MTRRDPYYLPPDTSHLTRRHYYRRANQRWWPCFLRFTLLLSLALCLLAQVLANFQ